MNDITFECPHCKGSLVVEERGAGLGINCPKCGQAITIPCPKSKLSSVGWIVIGVIVFVVICATIVFVWERPAGNDNPQAVAPHTTLTPKSEAPSYYTENVSIPPVEKRIEKQVKDKVYEARVTFNGWIWRLFCNHYPEGGRSSAWFKLTYRQQFFMEPQVQEYFNLYNKFLEWNEIALKNHVAEFQKQIMEIDNDFSKGSPSQVFCWHGEEATLRYKCGNETYDLDANGVGLFRDLLLDANKIREEWKSKQSEAKKAVKLFQ